MFTFVRLSTIVSYNVGIAILHKIDFLDTVKETGFENRHSRTAICLVMVFQIIWQQF